MPLPERYTACFVAAPSVNARRGPDTGLPAVVTVAASVNVALMSIASPIA